MIGIDTTAIIDLIKGEKMPNLSENDEFVLADLVYFESLLSMKKTDEIKRLCANLQKVSMTHKSAENAAEIFKKLKREGKEIGPADCIIAATYLEKGVSTILTRNAKHFERIPGIKVLTY